MARKLLLLVKLLPEANACVWHRMDIHDIKKLDMMGSLGDCKDDWRQGLLGLGLEGTTGGAWGLLVQVKRLAANSVGIFFRSHLVWAMLSSCAQDNEDGTKNSYLYIHKNLLWLPGFSWPRVEPPSFGRLVQP